MFPETSIGNIAEYISKDLFEKVTIVLFLKSLFF